MTPGRPSLGKRVIQESILGRRGLVKTNTLWLALSVAASTGFAPKSAGPYFLILFSVFAWSQGSILANDIADRSDDLFVGKKRWIQGIPLNAGVPIAILLPLAGLVAAFAAGSSFVTLFIYLFAVFFGYSYSLSPLRFKDRGGAGPLVYSLSGVFAFALLPIAWLGGLSLETGLFIGFAVFLDKWINLHFHQVVDYGADRDRGIETLATTSGLERAKSSLRTLSTLSSILFPFLLVSLVWSLGKWTIPIYLGALVLFCVGIRHFRHIRGTPKGSALTRELPGCYLVGSFLLFRYLPLLLLFRLASGHSAMISVFLIALFLIVLELHYSLHYRYD